MRELKFVIPEQNLADIKLFLINFECDSRAVDTPYTSDILYGPKSDCRYFTDISKRTYNRLVTVNLIHAQIDR